MPRAYYRIPAPAWDAAVDDGSTAGAAIEQHRTGASVYVLAVADPSPILAALPGAVRLGARISQVSAALRGHFVESRVRRTISVDGIERSIEARVRGTPEPGDEILEAGIPRVVIAGDDPADYL